MKIFSPLRNSSDVDALVEAGADEFYCGYVNENWFHKFGNEAEINRRSFCGDSANFIDIEDLQQAVRKVHHYEKKIMLAMNHHQFVNNQLEEVYHMIDEFSHIGGDGIILADLNAIQYAKKLGMYVAISTDLNVYNHESVNFFRDLGADRIIFSRDISFEDMKHMMQSTPDMEYETFMLNGPCKFSDSLCLALHSTEHGAFCRHLSNCDFHCKSLEHTNDLSIEADPLHRTVHTFFHDYMQRSCGICAIWRLIDAGVTSCKLVGRVLPVERIIEELHLLSKNIEIARNCNSEEEYLRKMINPYTKEDCQNGYQCFYALPEYYQRSVQ